MPLSFSVFCPGFAQDRYVTLCAHTKVHSRGLVNSSAKQLPTYLSYSLLCHSHFQILEGVFCTGELKEIRSGQLLSRMHRLPSRSWLLKHDLRWWEVSCWLISTQPWTALWASGPSSLLTEPCAKDKTFLCCVQCDHALFPLLSAVSFLYWINWMHSLMLGSNVGPAMQWPCCYVTNCLKMPTSMYIVGYKQVS